MENASATVNKLNEGSMVELTGKIMVVALILLFLVVIFVFLFHLYTKWFLNRRQQNNNNPATTRRRRRLDFSPGHNQEVINVGISTKGLDASLLKTIPVVLFNPKEFKDGLECTVCLCDVSEGEKTRFLPKCNHGFHVDCIDMWFQSHSTCPICRNPISKTPSPDSTIENIEEEENSASVEVANFPTNVLFWGNETQVSTLGQSLDESLQNTTSSSSPCPPPPASSSSLVASTTVRLSVGLVIDIPRQNSEEDQEPKSPMPTRLRSLKRLLSRDRRVNPSSPRIVDVEQGGSRGQS